MEKRTEGKPVIIANNGNMTLIFSEGKVYGDKIRKIEFTHDAPQLPTVEIEADEYPVIPLAMKNETFANFLQDIMKEI